MSQEKIDSGTVIVNKKGSEIGVIKKVYSPKLTRLELPNSDSIAFDPSFIIKIDTTGRLLKKKTAVIDPQADIFFKGASQTLQSVMENILKVLINNLQTKETKKAIQFFEFDVLTLTENPEKLAPLEAIGLVRGIELANKTPQDFIIKSVFQTAENKPELVEKIPPEIIIDKLNQEKAYNRILWNVIRIGISQAIRIKDLELINACCEAMVEIGLKHIEIEYKNNGSNDILYWEGRLEDSIFAYIGLLILNLEIENQENQKIAIMNYIQTNIKNFKINSNLRDSCLKLVDNFDLKKYDQRKTAELIHSGIKGFNLKVMCEKKAMKDLTKLINDFLNDQDPKNVNLINLRKNLDQFARETRDVSKEFINTLLEIGQFLKKIEYGDSKILEHYDTLMNNLQKNKYQDLIAILYKISQKFMTKEKDSK
ncbi:MAG: hypothetical protein ACFFDW_02295 [Candidatus Thorarchaeota archaeon]